MTKFYIKDERSKDNESHQVQRKLYKKIIVVTDKLGQMFRVNTRYMGSTTIKELVLLKEVVHEKGI